jgi:hypothetical protein
MDLYQAILERHSVRRYDQTPLDRATLATIDKIVDNVHPLVPDNRFRVLRRDVVTGEDLIAAMGGYGRVVSPPHYMVPYIVEGRHSLTDIAFRMEQMAVRLVQHELGMCFLGSLGRERDVRVRFQLPQDARIGAFLIFGRPADNLGGRTINAVIRRATGGAKKMSAERLFYQGTFEAPTDPPPALSRLIEAGRHAPSAKNAQPWRFYWEPPTLYLLIRRYNPRYGKDDQQDYRFFDAGLCMSNIALALEAQDREGQWELLHGLETDLPAFPDALRPFARLTLTA